MPKTFPGFSQQAITFLKQLEKNNKREWFQPRKEQFETLLHEPMLELAELLLGQIRTFAVDHVVDAKKAVHRIYRDVRFSKDKAPYKTNLSMMFPARGLSKLAGGMFYFSVSGKGVEIAGGVYMPGPPELAALRQAIVDDADTFRRTVDNPKLTKIVGPLRGESLARPPKGFAADHPAVDLLRRKQFYYYTELPLATATSPGLDKRVLGQFKAMTPAVNYMNGIMLLAAQGDEDDEPTPRRPKPMF